jgi:hypothetical protein
LLKNRRKKTGGNEMIEFFLSRRVFRERMVPFRGDIAYLLLSVNLEWAAAEG